MKSKLTQLRLKELLYYNPDTGIFTWIKKRNNFVKKGSRAGAIHSYGYIVIRIDKKEYKAHRLAFLYMEGYFPENDVDHINRERADNRWGNLREVSRSCNIRNSKILHANKSGITGVCWHRRDKKWYAYIRGSDKISHLGTFKNKLDAAYARWEAEKKYGYPNCNTTSSAYQYTQKYAQSGEDS